MSGPADAGLFIYAKDLTTISTFYQSVVGMQLLHKTDDLVVLQSASVQLLIHQIPANIATDIEIKSPPTWREESALKFFFTVPSIADARAVAESLGGEVTHENWQGPGFIVCNAVDTEGNIFHLRERTTTN